MKILDVVASTGLSGYFVDDQKAIKEGSLRDGFVYSGQPMSPGFNNIRQIGESVSITLLLEDGQVAYGDCVSVQYSGVAGRPPIFEPHELVKCIENKWGDWLHSISIDKFRPLVETLDSLPLAEHAPRALMYGISQALLDAVSKTRHITMAEVISQEYGTQMSTDLIPLFSQSGDDRYVNVDKMILKKVKILPHGLINNLQEKVGRNGEILLDYVSWLSNRITTLSTDNYKPLLHLDVYGTLGEVFHNDLERIADYLGEIYKAALPYRIQIEGPIDAGSKSAQIEDLHTLRMLIKKKGIGIPIVADEWCNTLDDIYEFITAEAADFVQIKTPCLGNINNTIKAILFSQEKGSYTYLGGSCNETDRCAQVCAHLALALKPDQMLAKPGMGVDEGLMIMHNEMQRTLAMINLRTTKTKLK